MASKQKITIGHLYPDKLNVYGDIGNIIALKKRCKWREIDVNIKQINLKDDLPRYVDIYFMGGGQDKDQTVVSKNFVKQGNKLKRQLDKGVVMLAVCAGYQMLGKYFIGGKGNKIEGIGYLDLVTKAPNDTVKDRCIGNVVAKLNPEVFNLNSMPLSTIVGFENHIGQTHLSKKLKPLAFIQSGSGNNKQGNTEGCIYKNVLCTYLHGSFLPKNPHIANWLILKALKRKYGEKVQLKKLNDKEEIKTHKSLAGLDLS